MTTTASKTPSRTCKATTKSGKPCGAHAVEGSDYCYMHDPKLAAERAAARRKGGQARHGRQIRHIVEADPPPAALATPGDMLDALEFALTVAIGLEPSHSQVRSIVAVVTAAVKVAEVGELENRIAALEELQAAKVGSNGRY